MAIHSALPNDLGISLWSWSAQDPDFAAEWEDAGDYESLHNCLVFIQKW